MGEIIAGKVLSDEARIWSSIAKLIETPATIIRMAGLGYQLVATWVRWHTSSKYQP